jgi:putative hydrolases of HD superfamily
MPDGGFVHVTTAHDAITLIQFFDRLASLPRTGWLLRGITNPESIAEHCYGVCVVAALLVDNLRERDVEIDGEKVLRMALVHDAAEAFTGDVPMPAKTADLKDALERAEASLLERVLPKAELACWREAEAGESLEARVVKAADKIQMLVKALTYEQQRRGHLDEFWENAKNRRHMDLPFAQELFAELDRLAASVRSTTRDGP